MTDYLDILGDIPRGAPERGSFDHATPAARWQDPKALRGDPDYRFDGGKIFLGLAAGEYIGIGDDRHAMLVAGSRSGKGRSVIIPTLIEYRGSVLAIDPKAELAGITARRRARGLGQSVAVLDPFDIGAPWLAPYRAAFNPLDLLHPITERTVDDAALITDALVVMDEKDRHWDESAKAFIEGVILHVATDPAHEGARNLLTVRRLLMGVNSLKSGAGEEEFDPYAGEAEPDGEEDEPGPDSLDALRAAMEANARSLARDETGEHVGYAIGSAAADFFDKPDRERMSVLSVARRHTKFLSSPALERVLTGGSIRLTDLKEAPSGMTIYLCLPAGRMGTHGRWFRLFVNLALEAMERIKHAPRIPVLFCLDEFASLGHMKQIEDAAGQIAGFGVKLWPILQDLTQLRTLYRDRWETFLGNAGVIQFFGNNDLTTLEFISKRLGKTSFPVHSRSHITAANAREGAMPESWSMEVHDLLTPEEISRYIGRDPQPGQPPRQVVIHAGRAPILIERVNYDEEPCFAGEYDDLFGYLNKERGA